MTKRTIIYVPGIGDRRRGFNLLQQGFLATWLAYGFSGRLFIMDWRSSQPFSERFDELLENIDTLHAQGVEVSLVGASAGAATVLLAFLARPDKLTGVVTVCGQIGGTAALHGPVAATNPRFHSSLALLQENIARLTESERGRVMTLRPRVDRIVPPHEAVLPGAVNYEMSVSGHMVGIGSGLLLEAPRIARFLREVASRPAR